MISEHFEKFGEITDVYISSPGRHFAFVTFADVRVAHSLIGKEHRLLKMSVYLSKVQCKQNQGKNKEDENEDRRSRRLWIWSGRLWSKLFWTWRIWIRNRKAFVELWTHENGRRYGHMMNQRGGWGGGYHRSPGELYREYMARQGGYDGPGGQGKERGMGGYRPEKMGQGYGDSRCYFKHGSYPGYGAYGPGRLKNMD